MSSSCYIQRVSFKNLVVRVLVERVLVVKLCYTTCYFSSTPFILFSSNLMLSSFQTNSEMDHPSCSRDVKDIYLLQEESIFKNIHTREVISLASNTAYVSYEEPTNLSIFNNPISRELNLLGTIFGTP